MNELPGLLLGLLLADESVDVEGWRLELMEGEQD
ncbi:hypothetical protein CLV72_11012 [Allonocardiopsis opalescens]|uniref:Uncharacterized protein n=1 Tax=Allonocardiopsis opalescens TaxID=1144618 RepID=A0A2T0PTM8_9ACTN|nr:hypothetical protein CLV72_11012 [Allonocardiopsis opalescens]